MPWLGGPPWREKEGLKACFTTCLDLRMVQICVAFISIGPRTEIITTMCKRPTPITRLGPTLPSFRTSIAPPIHPLCRLLSISSLRPSNTLVAISSQLFIGDKHFQFCSELKRISAPERIIHQQSCTQRCPPKNQSWKLVQVQ